MTARTKQSLDTFKSWAFPTVVTIFGWFATRTLTTMQDDIKLLLAQSNITTTNVTNNERRISRLEDAVYSNKVTASSYHTGASQLRFPDRLFRHEEEFDIKKVHKL